VQKPVHHRRAGLGPHHSSTQDLLHQPLPAKDGEVAFEFQPFVVLSHCFPGAVIETKWPTR